MTQSAKNCPPDGLRARKREATRSAITATARLFTTRHGLNGFTIEQLCEEVGVSRRTFFNYFPSKEDAILGYLQDEFPEQALTAFLAGGPGDAAAPTATLSATLLRDLFALTSAMVAALDLSREHLQELHAAIGREPQLLLKILGSAEEREHEFAALIARRERRAADDPAAAMAAAMFAACSQRAAKVFFSPGNTTPFQELLAGNLRAAHQLFTISDLTLEGEL